LGDTATGIQGGYPSTDENRLMTSNSSETNQPSHHAWSFFRAGGVEQVRLRQGADIVHLRDLDQKLWVALACPTRGLEFDNKTLDLLDTDKDQRIRVPEVLTAIAWLSQVLKNADDLLKGADVVPLDAIDDRTPQGAAVLAGAKRILANLGKSNVTSVCLADLADTTKIFAATKFNGDGIIPADSAPDETIKKVIEEIIATHGGVPDRSGKPGIDRAKLDAFFKEAAAFSDWYAKAEADPLIWPVEGTTAAAFAAVKAVRAKVDDYFARCRLAAFDGRAVGPLNRAETEFALLACKELTVHAGEIAQLPLARVQPGGDLPLRQGVNPAWESAVASLAAQALAPMLGDQRSSLSERDWASLLARLAPYEAWLASKPATAVEKLGLTRIRELLKNNIQATIAQLLAQDLALEAENAQVATVEKLIRFHRDLYRFLSNFVNFSDFYSRSEAVFQAGILYLDGRSCHLCVQVLDPAKHALLAGLSQTCLAYCECSRPGSEKMTVATGFTNGDADHLIVGRNGIFYDRKGRDWDATITKIISNPISIREAFWAPYKKFARMIEEQVAKRAAEADSQDRISAATAALAAANKDKVPGKAPRQIDVGTVAALGVALGGIGAMVTGILSAFFGLGFWMPVGFIGVLLLISGPSMLLAFLKLRQRNLGPILDANGWAVNGRARINVPFGAALTNVAALPHGAHRSLDDPYREKKKAWRFHLCWCLLLFGVVFWYLGKLDSLLPGRVKSTVVLGTNAPAYTPPTPEKPKP
jgi:hypothetical protein